MTRTALVAGASRGIGAAVAAELRARSWTVVTVARSKGDVRADVSTPAGAKKALGAVRRLDLLVVAAGDFAWTPVSRVDVKAFDRIFDSNLRTAWHCVREALPRLRKSKGSIVLFGGTVTQRVRGNPKAVAYAMAKTALTVFATSLARAEKHVRVNVVNPGIIEGGKFSNDVPGRKGKPEEVAKAVAWLASDEASHVSGAVLDVGGGLYV
jgi:3-oxoacyl-[acyl-carrier protein] reductase